MIGIRALVPAVLALAVPLAALGAGGPGPWRALAARELIADRGLAARDALDALDRALVPALEAGRRGSARVVAGDEPPGPELRRAAELVRAADPVARSARHALHELDVARRAAWPRTTGIPAPAGTGELTSIAGQLSAAAAAGEAFASMRAATASVVEGLDAALTALDDGELDAAEGAARQARRAHDLIADWDAGLPTLPVWLTTTDAMISGVETIVDRVRAGDRDAARAAAGDLAAMNEEARTADRALRIALSEGGAAVAGSALVRLAGVLAETRAARATVASVLEAVDR